VAAMAAVTLLLYHIAIRRFSGVGV
jgi:hypothetical protein